MAWSGYPKRPLDIGLDVDNTLYPWTSTITRWIERRKGLLPGSLDDHALTWTWYKDQWGMSESELMEHYAAGVHARVIFTHGDPSQGSLAMARRLADAGHRLHYLTNREIPGVSENLAHRRTSAWLHRNGFPVHSITITDDKTTVPTDVFLDDGPQNILALLAAGHPCPVVLDKPYNKVSSGVPAQARRAKDFHAFERIVAIEANR